MFENIQVFEKRYEELNQKLCDPTVLTNPTVYAELMKEHRREIPRIQARRRCTSGGPLFVGRERA